MAGVIRFAAQPWGPAQCGKTSQFSGFAYNAQGL